MRVKPQSHVRRTYDMTTVRVRYGTVRLVTFNIPVDIL